MTQASRKMPEPATLAEVIVDALARHGVARIFGIPGGGSSLALIDAAAEAGIDFVLTRTETAAAIMAAVTGELTGAPGVVLTGIGPGAASAVNGVAYASLEHAPVILLVDGPAASHHQAFDQQALYAPITKMQCRLRPESGSADIAACIAAALTPPWGPVYAELTAADAVAQASGPVGAVFTTPPPAAEAGALDQARKLLGANRRPLLLAGLDARHGDGPAALRRLAETLACPVLLTYKAKGVLPGRHSNMVGLITGAAAEMAAVGRADLILRLGFDPVELIPGAWQSDAPILDLNAGEARALVPAARASDWTAAEIAGLRDGLRARLALAGAGHTAETVVDTLAAGG
jgi:acetolactate synthase-1/2/3 large subunit